MLVYGDRSETVDPRAYVQALRTRWLALDALPPGLAKHAAVTHLLIDVGKLVQGLGDAAFDSEGADDGADLMPMIAASALAGRFAASWFGEMDPPAASPQALATVLEADLPEAVEVREPEGYAFYALYPELYLTTGARLFSRRASPAVIGLRSIGASLAPAAACGACGRVPITLRPAGDPFDRRLRIGAVQRDRLLRQAKDGVLVVDEGPGASGSSFGAVGDWLEDAGVPPDTITYMPSHGGDLGPQASERHRGRWRTAKTAYASFEDVILPRLPGWVEPLIGPLTQPLADLSGGLWRAAAGIDAPAWPEQERRKYLATTRRGEFLLKFAGLGNVGARKLERAKALHTAGFTPEPLGLAHGVFVERFLSPAHAQAPTHPLIPLQAGMSGEAVEEELGAYLGFRARALEPPYGGAPDDLLRTLMRRNFDLAGLSELGEQAHRLPAGERGPPCAIDGRLHAWEWRRGAHGRLIKLDALDHCESHDLIGAQDVAWDLAGFAVEFRLSPGAAERLRRITVAEARQAIDPRRVDFQTLAYLAFQIGWWTFAAQGREGARAQAEVDRYTGLAARWSPLA